MDYYKVLGVDSKEITDEEVLLQYRLLQNYMKKYPVTQEYRELVGQAYYHLKTTEKREEYQQYRQQERKRAFQLLGIGEKTSLDPEKLRKRYQEITEKLVEGKKVKKETIESLCQAYATIMQEMVTKQDNLFTILGISPEVATNEKIKIRYEQIRKSIEQGKLKASSEQKKMLDMAYIRLATEKERKEYQLELECKKVNETRRTPQEYLKAIGETGILPGLVDSVQLKKQKNAKDWFILVRESSTSEEEQAIGVKRIGELQWSNVFGVQDYIQAYEVISKQQNGQTEQEVFFTNINRELFYKDQDYRRLCDQLLSKEYRMPAKKYLGGYLGEIVEKQDGYDLFYDRDILNAAFTYQRKKNRIGHTNPEFNLGERDESR